MPRHQSRYSEAQRAEALAFFEACGRNQSRAARACGVPTATLRDWIKGVAMTEDTHEKTRMKKAELSDRIEELAHLLLDAAPGKIGEATLPQIMVGLGIATDKLQLLRNKPTVITEDVHALTDESRAARITLLLDNAGTRRD